ncbi:MAG TPA: DUF4131 domain-containing protein [Clostridiales bacterium]|nr:DUF4131 domain-containing protein [Clostridiales bacterium]
MGRLLFASALTAASMSALAVFIPFNACVVLAIVLLILLFLCVLLPKQNPANRYAPFAFVAFVTVLYLCLLFHFKINPILSLGQKEAQIEGVVIKEPEYNDNFTVYTIKTDKVKLNGAPQKIKLRVISSTGLGADIYDQIYTRVKFYKFDKDKLIRYSDGIFLGAVITDAAQTVPVIKKPLYFNVVEFRRSLKSKLYNTLSYNTAALLSGIIMGDTSGIEEPIYANLKSSGVLHVMSVSGLHIAILCQTLLMILSKTGVGKRISASICLVAVIAIMAVAGFSASVVRSGITYIIMLIGLIIARKPDPLNSLGAAFLAILAANPFAVADVSLLLSVCATFGLIVISPVMYNWAARRIKLSGVFRKLVMANVLIICQSVSAVISTLPVTIVMFGEVSIIAPVANVIVNYPVFLALICTVLAALFFMLPFTSFVAYPLLLIAAVCSKIIIKVTAVFDSNVFEIRAGNRHIHLWVVAALLVIAVYLLIKKEKFRLGFIMMLSVFMLASSSLAFAAANKDVTKIGIINLNQSAAVVVARNGHAVVIGTGADKTGAYRISDYLKQENVPKLDLLILPCLEQNDAGGGIYLLKRLKADNIIIPNVGRYHKYYSSLNCSQLHIGDNVDVTLWDDVKLTTVRNSQYGNSIYISIGSTNVLICAPSADINSLPDDFKKANIIISPTAIPEGIQVNHGTQVFVCGETRKAVAAANTLAKWGIKPYMVSDYQAFEIKTRGVGNDITIHAIS